MAIDYQKYAKAITDDLLGLRPGDALSINTEERDLEFARTVAQRALEITDVTVKVVVTNKGKISQVLDFDPAPPAHRPVAQAMLRICHRSPAVTEGDFLDVVVDPTDLGAIQKLGHLAEPVVLGRRIAVPWCVAEVYDEEDDESWDAVFRKIDLNIPNQSLSAMYRSRSYETSGITEMHFEGEGTSFSVGVPSESLFRSGHQILASGREFLSGMDFDRLSFLVDKDSVNGRFRADVTVFGVRKTVDFTFENGLLVDWTHSQALDRLLSFDELLRRVGYITMRDNEIIVNLGGALSDALSQLPVSEELIPDWFNMSLYTLECVLERNLDVSCTDSNGITRQIARDGVFLE